MTSSLWIDTCLAAGRRSYLLRDFEGTAESGAVASAARG